MTSVAEHVPFHSCKAPPASGSRQLLARLSGLFRRRLFRLNPEELPPHLLRDLGLAEQGIHNKADNPWIR
jgi:uncharacterized protein YjiS (DUF1127 family)